MTVDRFKNVNFYSIPVIDKRLNSCLKVKYLNEKSLVAYVNYRIWVVDFNSFSCSSFLVFNKLILNCFPPHTFYFLKVT